MNIKIEPYNAKWDTIFKSIEFDLKTALKDISPKIDHVGSTSIKGLSAKPIIDILVGVAIEDDLDKTIQPILANGYIYYELYNEAMPYRRFFIKPKNNSTKITTVSAENEEAVKDVLQHDNRLAHIHVIPTTSIHWKRHIAFREYLKMNDTVRLEYQNLKEHLSLQQWENGNQYNTAKNDFIKYHEAKALEWFAD